jgi:hypothetical protein
VYGGVPPDANMAETKIWPICPKLDAHVSESDDDATGAVVIPQLLVAEAPSESTTLDVSLNDPVAVGVPVIAPVDALSVRPVGRLPPVRE